jgi:acyl carrier protein
MADAEARLIKCFSGVFPELSEDEIPKVTLGTVESWDSVATITLLTVVEEEFGVEFEPEVLEHLHSFEAILEYLRSQKGDC